MFGTLTLISALASVAFAQSSTSSAAAGSSTQNPLIPASVSTTCATFLNTLNTDSGLKTCLNALNTATSAFSPGNNATVTKATVTTALGNLCADSVSSACPDNYIRSKITDFWTYCNAELTSQNVDIIRMYDAIYTMSPIRTSACSKDDSGNYCVLASPSTGASSSSLAQLLATLYTTTGSGAQTVLVPNMSTFHDKNIQFFFYNSGLDATTLCTTCARQVLTAFMTFESNVAYGPGLGSSQLLNTQPALYEAIKEKCPAGFLSGAVQAAGGLSGGYLSSAATAAYAPEQSTMFALFLGLVSLAVSFY